MENHSNSSKDLEENRLELDKSHKSGLTLSRKEVEALYQYFLSAGYISYELDPLVHEIFDKLHKLVKENVS